jgi:hypothetical protein
MLTYPIGFIAPKDGDNAFKLSINTALGTGTTLALPLPSGETYDFWWNPGDGSPDLHVTAYNDADATYDYGVAFSGQVSIGTQSGDKCGGWSFNNGGDKLKVTSIDQWGQVDFDYLVNGFYGCSNMSMLPISGNIPGTSSIVDLSSLFRDTAITRLYAGVFDLLSEVVQMQFICANSSLTTIDIDVFRYNTKVTNFNNSFQYTSLSSLPENVFFYNKLVTTYVSTFIFVPNIALPSVMFDLSALSIVTSFSFFMFTNSGLNSNTGTIQDIWNYALSATSTSTFEKQTALTNYASIPNSWKGL